MRTDHLVSETLERVRRIELLALAWKAKVLPLYDTRIILLYTLVYGKSINQVAHLFT